MSSLFDSNLFEALHHPDYWNRNPNSWGSLSDWDIYYINHTPGSTKMKAHQSLGLELKVLLKRLSKTSYGYYKAIELQKLLKDCHNDPVNIELWQEHSTKLGRLAVENRMNKREILTVGIHAATIAVATKFTKDKTKEEKIQEKFWTVDDFDDNKENDYEPDDTDKRLSQHQTHPYVIQLMMMNSLCKTWNCLRNDHEKREKMEAQDWEICGRCLDKFLQLGFTTDELTEICETMTMQEAPQIEDELLEYIDTFAKTSTKDIREALYASHPRFCRDYNPLIDFAYEHVRTAVTDWVRLLEMQPNPLTQQDLPISLISPVAPISPVPPVATVMAISTNIL
nr:554_t:CDS:2 [Entrophospora candida]